MIRLLAISLLLAAGLAQAFPYTMTYSGRLTNGSGAPVTGDVTLEPKFFDAVDSETPLFTAPSGSVSLNEGVFSINISFTDAQIQTIFSNDDVWIEVHENYPRQRFMPVPYAFRVPVDESSITYDADGKLKVKDGYVSSVAVSDGGITTVKIEDGAVTSTKIENNTITNNDIANETITTTEITNGTIEIADLKQDICGANQILKVNAAGNAIICAPSFYIDDSGNVGIGGASAGEKFEVTGKVKTTSLQVTGGTPGVGKVLESDASGNLTFVEARKFEYCGETSASYTGATVGGWSGAKTKCRAVAGCSSDSAKMCSFNDIMTTLENGNASNIPLTEAWILGVSHALSSYIWTLDHCSNWSSASSGYLGFVTKVVDYTEYRIRSDRKTCNNSYPIACCDSY